MPSRPVDRGKPRRDVGVARRACTTTFVAAEDLHGFRRAHGGLSSVRAAVSAGWQAEVAPSTREELRLFEALCVSLGLGEAASIALARRRGLVFAGDDKAALAGVRLTGTIGILPAGRKRPLPDPVPRPTRRSQR